MPNPATGGAFKAKWIWMLDTRSIAGPPLFIAAWISAMSVSGAPSIHAAYVRHMVVTLCPCCREWSMTSFAELARDVREIERWNRLHPKECRRKSYVAKCLTSDAPVLATTDYVCAYPDLVARFVRAPYRSLGTDGLGRSDNRASLRRFFEVKRPWMFQRLRRGAVDS